MTPNHHSCVVCHCLFDENILLPLGLLHEDIHTSIRKDHALLSSDGYICRPDLSNYTPLLKTDTSNREKEVFANYTNIETTHSFADRCSDALTSFAGSWSFLIWFGVFLAVWMVPSSFVPISKFDPYPFIFLNLVLAVISSVQGPIILMSQNRQAQSDRARVTYDYAVDLKAEMEIRQIQENIKQILKKINKLSIPPKTPKRKES